MRPDLFSRRHLDGSRTFVKHNPGYCGYGCGLHSVPYHPGCPAAIRFAQPRWRKQCDDRSDRWSNQFNSVLNSSFAKIEYPVAVWYQGGVPLTSPQVRLSPESTVREGREMHEGMMHEGMMREGMMDEGRG